MPTYKIHYFNVRGLAEPIRMMLAHTGADWSDERIPFVSIPTPIPDEIKAKSTYGQVPLLEFDGTTLSQSQTIMRFLARKFNLVGADDLEAARCDEVADGVKDFGAQWSPVWSEKDEEKKKEMLETAKKNVTEKFLRVFNSMVEKNGGLVVGKQVTWADFLVAYSADSIETLWKIDLLSPFPALKAHREKIYNLSGTKEYIASRPVTQF